MSQFIIKEVGSEIPLKNFEDIPKPLPLVGDTIELYGKTFYYHSFNTVSADVVGEVDLTPPS